MSRKVWINGSIRPEDEAKVSIYDSALMFGDMVFEMTRSFNGKQFKLREHLERLFRSAKYFQIPMDTDVDSLMWACERVQNANEFEPDDEHRLMINVSRGILPMYSEVGETGTRITISDFPLRWTVAGMGRLFEVGINAVTPSQRAIPATLLDPKVKCRSRAHLLMANMEVANYEGDNNWPLLLDPDGYVTESTGANFFIRKDAKIITPKNNALKGISRAFILSGEVCAYDMVEDDITIYDVYDADEAFLTATPFCILPVTSINGQDIAYGGIEEDGVFTSTLRMWSDCVGVNIKAQIQAWDDDVKEGPSAYKFK